MISPQKWNTINFKSESEVMAIKKSENLLMQDDINNEKTENELKNLNTEYGEITSLKRSVLE